jgi:oligopeptide/dipeptide ABC transporter ATP-binding protein
VPRRQQAPLGAKPVSLLEVDGVTHRYGTTGSRPVLDEVRLTLEANEVVSLVGESGCGKTTLGKVVAGLVRPTSGQVRFRGRDIWSLTGAETRSWRRLVQLVHQDPYASLNPGLTIGSTLSAGLIHQKLTGHRDLQDHMLALLGRVGLDATPDFLRRYPHQLSGGQRQRVAIARAVSVRPELIVADEVTSMLDVSMRLAILDLLRSLGQERHAATLFISHDLGVVRYFSRGGRILVMFYGVIVEDGPAEDVILHPGHPYTYRLLEAVPVAHPALARHRSAERASESLENVEGQPSGTGCVYSSRCPFAGPRCRQSRPALVELRTGHRTACYFPERVPSPPHRRGGGGTSENGQYSAPDRNDRARL